VGRAPHVAALDACLERAASGAGQVLLISGEAGIGKTRLVSEALARAQAAGYLVLLGACYETDRALPYAPFIDLLRTYVGVDPGAADALANVPNRASLGSLLPELREPVSGLPTEPSIDADSSKRDTVHAFHALFAQLASTRPLLVVIEDVHWSDDTSAELLLHLARHTRSAAIALVLTFRPDELHPALAGLLAGLNRERLAAELHIQRLSRGEIDAMLQAIFRLDRPARADFLDLLANLSEGNPFLIEEILRSLVASGEIYFRDGQWDRKPVPELHVPRSVREAVDQRLAMLSESARRSVQLAAVVGRRFGFTLLQRLCGSDEPALLASMKELLGAGVVVEESAEVFAFRHALTREAVYAGLLARERQALHRQVAELIEQLHTNEPEALDDHLDLAYHYFEAAIWDKALDFGLRAGERALALYAPRAAVDQLTRALSAAGHLGVSVPVELRYARGQAYHMLGEFEPARDDLEAVLEDARSEGDERLAWRALLDLALLWAGRDYERTGAYVREALMVAEQLNDRTCIADSLNRLGNWHMNVQQTDAALDCHQRALSIFEELADRRGIAETLDLLGVTSQQAADPIRAGEYYDRAIPLLRELDDRPRLIDALVLRTVIGGAYTLDRVAPSVAVPVDAHAGLTMARDIGWRAGESFAAWELALWLGPRGEYARALELATSALHIAEEIQHRQWMAGARCALAALHQDVLALEEAGKHAEIAVELARAIGSPVWIAISCGFRASIAVGQRDLDRAVAILAQAGPAESPPRTMGQRLIVYARAELLLARRQPAAALELLEQLEAGARSAACVTPRRELVRGESLAALQRQDEAEAALLEARRGADAIGSRSLAWRINAALGRVYARQRRSGDAEAAFGMARGIVAELAHTLPAGPLRDTFAQQAGGQLPAVRPVSESVAARERFGGLTGREREVAALLARGLSNRAIADQLVVGERTVETYVSSILNKLGYTSRAQIAAWAVDRGLATPD
jgi:DNA-binding CsgD family transcriptional regulator